MGRDVAEAVDDVAATGGARFVESGERGCGNLSMLPLGILDCWISSGKQIGTFQNKAMHYRENLSSRKAAKPVPMNWGACVRVSRPRMHVLWNPPVASLSDSVMGLQHQESFCVPCLVVSHVS